MDAAARAAEAGAVRGTVVGADEQTAGRGRRGHEWSSPPGAGLYFSCIAKPARHVSLLTLAAGVAVRHGILQATGLVADLEWPNDVVVGRRKLAGILAEGLRVATPGATVIVGIGINVHSTRHPPDVGARATSIETEVGRAVDRGAVLAAVLECLHDHFDQLANDDADGILREWRTAAPSAEGVRVEWDVSGAVMSGTTAGVDATGALLVRTPQGIERLIAGEVRWERPS